MATVMYPPAFAPSKHLFLVELRHRKTPTYLIDHMNVSELHSTCCSDDICEATKTVEIKPMSNPYSPFIKEQIVTLTQQHAYKMHGGTENLASFHDRVFIWSERIKWEGKEETFGVDLMRLEWDDAGNQLELVERRGNVDKIVIEFTVVARE